MAPVAATASTTASVTAAPRDFMASPRFPRSSGRLTSQFHGLHSEVLATVANGAWFGREGHPDAVQAPRVVALHPRAVHDIPPRVGALPDVHYLHLYEPDDVVEVGNACRPQTRDPTTLYLLALIVHREQPGLPLERLDVRVVGGLRPRHGADVRGIGIVDRQRWRSVLDDVSDVLGAERRALVGGVGKAHLALAGGTVRSYRIGRVGCGGVVRRLILREITLSGRAPDGEPQGRGVVGIDDASPLGERAPEVDGQGGHAEDQGHRQSDHRERCPLLSLHLGQASPHSHRKTPFTVLVYVAGFRPGTKGMFTVMSCDQMTVTDRPIVESLHATSSVGEPGPMAYPTAAAVTFAAIRAFVHPVEESG